MSMDPAALENGQRLAFLCDWRTFSSRLLLFDNILHLRHHLLLLLVRSGVLCKLSSLPHVGGEDDEIEVLVDVVHDLGLEEHLGGVVHDLVAQLGLGDVLPQLLDARAAGLLRAVLVYNLIINKYTSYDLMII